MNFIATAITNNIETLRTELIDLVYETRMERLEKGTEITYDSLDREKLSDVSFTVLAKLKNMVKGLKIAHNDEWLTMILNGKFDALFHDINNHMRNDKTAKSYIAQDAFNEAYEDANSMKSGSKKYYTQMFKVWELYKIVNIERANEGMKPLIMFGLEDLAKEKGFDTLTK